MRKLTLLEKYFLYVFFLILPLHAKSQTEIKYDQYNAGDIELPYDKEITIVMPIENKSIIFPKHIKLVELKGAEKSFTDNNAFQLEGYLIFDKTKKQNLLRVTLPPLKPNRSYRLGILTKVSNNEFQKLIKVFHSLQTNKFNDAIEKYINLEKQVTLSKESFESNFTKKERKDVQKIKDLYDIFKKPMTSAKFSMLEYTVLPSNEEILNKLINDIMVDALLDIDSVKVIINELNQLNKDFKDNILTPYYEFAKTYKSNNINSTIFDLSGYLDFLKGINYKEYNSKLSLEEITTCLKKLNLKTAQNCNCENNFNALNLNIVQNCNCENNFNIKETFDSFAANIENFLFAEDISANDIIQGLISFEKISEKSSKEDYYKRIENLKYNILFLEKAHYVHMYNNSDCSTTIEDLINDSKQQLTYLNETIKSITSNYNTAVYKWIDGKTVKQEINTETQSIILADYGILYTYTNDHIIRPYFGLNIGLFGPINKNIRYTYLRNKLKKYDLKKKEMFKTWLRYHLSWHIGTTLGSIQKDNVQDDLYGKNNLLTGVSFRLDRKIRISSGFFLYQLENANPLIDEKEVNSRLYVSISFDLSVQKAAQQLSGLLFR